MAFFQFRKGRDEQPAPSAPAPSIESLRRRAMHRLIGAAVLVLAGVIGFPLVFDHQPRPIPVDMPIEIPDKNKVRPLVAPSPSPPVKAAAPPPAPAPVVEPAVAAAPAAAVSASAPAAGASLPAPATAKVPAKPAVATPDAPKAATSDALKAQALLDGKDASANASATDGRFVVQVGAFSDADKMREVRRKLEGAGLKTYTQVVETKEGSRTRVRVGPFPDKAEATRVADKIKSLELPATILAL